MATVISTVCNEKPFRAQKHENICKLFYLCTANMNWKILWIFNKQEGNVAGWSLPSLSLSCGQEIYVCVLTMCKCWSIETELAEGQARVAFTSSCVRECISCSTCYIFPTGNFAPISASNLINWDQVKCQWWVFHMACIFIIDLKRAPI